MEVLADERGVSTAAFLDHAGAHFAGQGVGIEEAHLEKEARDAEGEVEVDAG